MTKIDSAHCCGTGYCTCTHQCQSKAQNMGSLVNEIGNIIIIPGKKSMLAFADTLIYEIYRYLCSAADARGDPKK